MGRAVRAAAACGRKRPWAWAAAKIPRRTPVSSPGAVRALAGGETLLAPRLSRAFTRPVPVLARPVRSAASVQAPAVHMPAHRLPPPHAAAPIASLGRDRVRRAVAGATGAAALRSARA
ncbi:hypothetical protein Acidovoranil_20710 [Acidovorax sp. FG27]